MLPLFIGLAVAGVIALGNRAPKTTTSAPTVPQTNADNNVANNPPNVDTSYDPQGQQPASVQTVTTSETGSQMVDTTQPSQPSSTSTAPPTPSYMSDPGPQVVTDPPPPTHYQVASYQVAYEAQYGTASTKAQQSGYYAQQQANGNIVV